MNSHPPTQSTDTHGADKCSSAASFSSFLGCNVVFTTPRGSGRLPELPSPWEGGEKDRKGAQRGLKHFHLLKPSNYDHRRGDLLPSSIIIVHIYHR